MSAAAEVAAAFGGRATATGWIARCPCHDDRVPSLSITEGAGGIVLLYCHARCSQKALVAEVRHRGLTLDGKPLSRRRVIATYDYRDENGNLIYQVQRWRPKEFRQRRPDGKDGWINNLDGVVRVPYRLPELLAEPEKPVFVVEGEKDADRLAREGLVATTNSGGVGASKSWSGMVHWFRDRRVVVLPDNDDPGRRHASGVAEALRDIAASIKIVRLPNLPAKGDVSDWLDAGHTIKELRQLAHATREQVGEIGRPGDRDEEAAVEPDIEDEIGRLAALTEVAYDRERKDAATRLGIRTSTLDKRVAEARSSSDTDGSGAEQRLGIPIVEPWPEPVDGAELLAEIVSTIRRYVVMNDHGADATALWVLHTHALDAAYITPRLSINSPEMRCGKTTLLDVLKTIVARPLSTANISTAALFRVLELARPTLLIDEVDSFLRNDDERRGIIDAGHCRGSATVLRCVGDDYDVKPFEVWGALALAGIGQLPGTIADRSITISLRRKRTDEGVASLRRERLDELRHLGRRAARWVMDHLGELKDADPSVPAELDDRAADNWRPLIAIADLAGGPWSQRARQAAIALTTAMETDEASIRTMLLADLRAMFEDAAVALPSSEIVDRLVRLEERPWAEIAGGKPISKNRLARLLKPFNVKPSQTWIDGKNQKSYRSADLEDAFARYLSAATDRPLEALESAGFEANENDRREQFLSVADAE